MNATQPTLFADSIEERFERWKQLPGARLVMMMYYRLALFYYRRFEERGVGVSIRLIEEKVRDEIRLGRLRGVKEQGYALNSHFSRCIERHMTSRRPKLKKIFHERGPEAETLAA